MVGRAGSLAAACQSLSPVDYIAAPKRRSSVPVAKHRSKKIETLGVIGYGSHAVPAIRDETDDQKAIEIMRKVG